MLCLSGDRYFNQDILIHEFSHGVHLVSAEDIDSDKGQPLFFSYFMLDSYGLPYQ